ncbi:MAG: RNA methyltransferase [bacterium]|nr:MAG: RNA methyltransferase [bacterium]
MDPGPGNRRPQDDITVILHRTSIPENIGAAVRVMANLGYGRLILSQPATGDWETARRLAVSASEILDGAQVKNSLKEAIAASGARFVVGTTARDRRYWDLPEVASVAGRIMERASEGGAAILFGPEDRGLSNEDLTLCHTSVTLPTGGSLASYNLSHAVAITLYAIMAAQGEPGAGTGRRAASFEEMEGMYGHLEEVLGRIQFLWEDNPDHMMRAVREFLNRAEPTEVEVRMIRGMCRRLLWHLGKREETSS